MVSVHSVRLGVFAKVGQVPAHLTLLSDALQFQRKLPRVVEHSEEMVLPLAQVRDAGGVVWGVTFCGVRLGVRHGVLHLANADLQLLVLGTKRVGRVGVVGRVQQ